MQKQMTQRQHRFHRSLESTMRHQCAVRPGDCLVVAVSGGMDSVGLLHAMHEVGSRSRWQLKLIVAHFAHHFGQRADDDVEADRSFVEQLADRLGLPFMSGQGSSSTTDNLEDAARSARYAFLESVALQHDAIAIVVAHHADDQAETMLMRMARGSSVRGLAGMRWSRPIRKDSSLRLIRPLLATDRDAIHDYLVDHAENWKDDHTNQDADYLRNYIRHEVLSRLKERAPHVSRKAAQLSDHLHEVNNLLDELADDLLSRAQTATSNDSITLNRTVLMNAKPALVSWMFRKLLHRFNVAIDSVNTLQMQKLVSSSQKQSGEARQFKFATNVEGELIIDFASKEMTVRRS